MDIEKTVGDRGILNVIQTLSSKGETGELQIKTGITSGALFFRDGRLVDAHVGNLTGFQAINAAASLPDASLSFDPSAAPPAVSSITPSERVVLKQFFGIDTVAPDEFHEPEALVADEEPEPVIADEEPEPVIAREDDEVTLVGTNNVARNELPIAPPYTPPPMTFQRSGLAVAAVVFLLATAAVALLYKFGDFSSPESVASVPSNIQPSSPPVAEQAKPQITPVDSNTSATPINHGTSAAPVDHSAPAARDLTGKWNIVNTVQKTSYSSYNNLQIGFDLSIEQSGKGFTGKGVKVSENGRTLPASSRTPIQVQGSIDGDRIEATFFEQGTARKTNGRFVWRIDKTGRLSGTFVTNAARSSGKSTARKV